MTVQVQSRDETVKPAFQYWPEFIIGLTVGLLGLFGVWSRGSSAAPSPRVIAAPSVVAKAPLPAAPQSHVTLDDARRDPATVEVLNMKPVDLTVGTGKDAWAGIPEEFAKYRTTIFAPQVPANGVAYYKVTAGGYLLVACNFDYQGNASGGWQADRWNREQFLAHGWSEVTPAEMGGPLVKGDNRGQVVFIKKVEAGESGQLRCNKYDPPFFILCSRDLPPPAAPSS